MNLEQKIAYLKKILDDEPTYFVEHYKEDIYMFFEDEEFSPDNPQFAFLENMDLEKDINDCIENLISRIVMKSDYIGVRDIIEDYFYHYNSKKTTRRGDPS